MKIFIFKEFIINKILLDFFFNMLKGYSYLVKVIVINNVNMFIL